MSEHAISDAALARSLGTNDAAILRGARAVLDDPDAEFVLAYLPLSANDDPDDEPALVWRDAYEEIDRIVDLYLPPPRTT